MHEFPGPIHPGDPVVHPARYTGTVDGKTMTFTVTETDTGLTLGKFVLTARSRRPRLQVPVDA